VKDRKKFKTIDQQIDYLEIDKAVKTCDRGVSSKFLLDYNYYNVVSCGKIKFAYNSENGKHKYNESNFEQWIQYFKLDQKLSRHLRNNVLSLELVINSRVAYYISELMESGALIQREKEAIEHIIQSSKKIADINFKSYAGHETWKYVTKMMFSDMKKLVFWLLENKREFYMMVVNGYSFLSVGDDESRRRYSVDKSRLNEINNLRNKLFHFTPLNIYLVYGKDSKGKLNNSEKRKVVKWVYRLSGNQKHVANLTEICNYSHKFIKMKKKPTINVD